MDLIPSDTFFDASSVRRAARESALSDFAFFANAVIDARLNARICDTLRDAVRGQYDVFVPCRNALAYANALSQWLVRKGVHVTTSYDLVSTPILDWLDLASASTSVTVAVTCTPTGVQLHWF